MGKNLIQQRRGKGSIFKSPGFKFKGKICFNKLTDQTLNGTVADLIKCPGHSAPLAKITFENKETILIPAPENIKVGDSVVSGSDAKPENGNIVLLRNIPEGSLINNIELTPGDGGKIIRTSGSFARVVAKPGNKVAIILPSKKEISVLNTCRACIGVIAGGGRLEKPFVKAGNKFHAMKARRKLYPIVCGTSMNSVSHPYGGSSSHIKGRPNVTSRNAPPGRKVGKLSPRRTGRKKR
jgi:large subunit ribosomal protein L2